MMATHSGRSPILQDLACPLKQAETPEVDPDGPLSTRHAHLSPTLHHLSRKCRVKAQRTHPVAPSWRLKGSSDSGPGGQSSGVPCWRGCSLSATLSPPPS